MEWSKALEDFGFYLSIERGLSEHTINSYKTDVLTLMHFLEAHKIVISPIQIDATVIQQFIYQEAKEKSAHSQSRRISGLKSFFKYLVFEKYRYDLPTQWLEAPKLGRKLPDTLSVEEVEKILAAIDLSKAEGHRNKALLETLYGSGLRVSELVNLQKSDIYSTEKLLRVTGKGDKQRLVPIGDYAMQQIDTYLKEIQIHQNIQKGYENYVFLNRRGKALTRTMIFLIVKQTAEKAGIKKK